MEELYSIALDIAERAHKGQFRKNSDEPYINHPRRVAAKWVLPDWLATAHESPLFANANKNLLNQKLVSILHDAVEDHPKFENEVKEKMPPEVFAAIKIITKNEGENYFDFTMRILHSGNKLAIDVKIADIEDNLVGLPEGNKRDKYKLAKYILENNI